MDTQKFLSEAGPIAFFAAAAVTAVTAPNMLVVLGGLGLSAAAAAAYATNTIKDGAKKIGHLIPSFALAANIPLTINGLAMAHQGITTGNANMALAGGLLALANGAFYGISNYKALTSGIAPESHAFNSMAAGTAIAGAGLALQDPVLAMIGAGFVTEAMMRFESVINKDLQPKLAKL